MKRIKSTFQLFLALCCMTTYAQEIKDRHIRKLEHLGVQYKTVYSFDEQATKDLHQILRFDHKRKAKKTTGLILLAAGFGTFIGGASSFRESKKYDRHGWSTMFKSALLTVGVLEIGGSIPLFIGAKKSKKNRDQLKNNYLSNQTETISALQAKFLKDNKAQDLSTGK